MNKRDKTLALEIARVGLMMVWDEIAEELDISDDEMQRLSLLINAELAEV